MLEPAHGDLENTAVFGKGSDVLHASHAVTQCSERAFAIPYDVLLCLLTWGFFQEGAYFQV